MPGGSKISEVFPRTADPHGWLSGYLRARARLASFMTEFHCDPACTRPGCKREDMQVPATIIDLLGVALHRRQSVSETYRRHFLLGLLADGRDNGIRLVLPRLRKPCPFLENDLCSIYPVRPLPCALFPEYPASRSDMEARAENRVFREYLCLQHPFSLSPERAQVLAELRGRWEREVLVSGFYLFGHGRCHLDCRNLMEQILPRPRSAVAADIEAQSASQRVPPRSALEHFFREHLARHQPFVGVEEKIRQLDDPEEQARFFKLLQDDRLVKKLRQAGEDKALVFRFFDGQLKARRRSLLPEECKFY